MSSKPAGRVSPTVMADCAGLVPALVRVKTRVVVAPSAMLAAPKVLATVGLVLVTVRQASAPPVVAFVAVMLACRLVWAACGQVPFTPDALVSPASVTVQLAVPLVIARLVRPLITREPVLYTAVAGPLQPAL